jgi:hypothetical protein
MRAINNERHAREKKKKKKMTIQVTTHCAVTPLPPLYIFSYTFSIFMLISYRIDQKTPHFLKNTSKNPFWVSKNPQKTTEICKKLPEPPPHLYIFSYTFSIFTVISYRIDHKTPQFHYNTSKKLLLGNCVFVNLQCRSKNPKKELKWIKKHAFGKTLTLLD